VSSGSGALDPEDAESMASWEHLGGFSLAASVCVEGADRLGLKRLLRQGARAVFAVERLREIDAEHLVYQAVKSGPSGPAAGRQPQLAADAARTDRASGGADLGDASRQ